MIAMSYMTAIETMPRDLQMPMLKVLDAFQRDMREQLAVRREDFEKLESTVYALGVAQRQSEARLTRLEEAVAQLAEAQRASEARLTRLEAVVEELVEAQKRTEHRVEELAEAQKRTEQRVAELAEAQRRSEDRLAHMEAAIADLTETQKRTEILWQRSIERQDKFDVRFNRALGWQLETQYRDKAHAYFGRVLRKVQVVSLQALEAEFESRLDDREWEDVSLLDLVVRGQATHHPQRPDVLLAFEISAVIDRGDVERSLRRAAMLRKVGYPVVSGVAGEDITQGGLEVAQKEHVFVVQNGHKDFWDEALAAALAA
jgi:predicted transcriptional regulator